MNRQALEDIECLLSEYADAVRATQNAKVNAGACQTAMDFRNYYKANDDEEQVLAALLLRVKALVTPAKKTAQGVSP